LRRKQEEENKNIRTRKQVNVTEAIIQIWYEAICKNLAVNTVTSKISVSGSNVLRNFLENAMVQRS
jgi:hypothetical protein